MTTLEELHAAAKAADDVYRDALITYYGKEDAHEARYYGILATRELNDLRAAKIAADDALLDAMRAVDSERGDGTFNHERGLQLRRVFADAGHETSAVQRRNRSHPGFYFWLDKTDLIDSESRARSFAKRYGLELV